MCFIVKCITANDCILFIFVFYLCGVGVVVWVCVRDVHEPKSSLKPSQFSLYGPKSEIAMPLWASQSTHCKRPPSS